MAKVKGSCDNCGVEIEVEYCCSGLAEQCGCMGMPIDPPICSEECYLEMVKKGVYRV